MDAGTGVASARVFSLSRIVAAAVSRRAIAAGAELNWLARVSTSSAASTPAAAKEEVWIPMLGMASFSFVVVV